MYYFPKASLSHLQKREGERGREGRWAGFEGHVIRAATTVGIWGITSWGISGGQKAACLSVTAAKEGGVGVYTHQPHQRRMAVEGRSQPAGEQTELLTAKGRPQAERRGRWQLGCPLQWGRV